MASKWTESDIPDQSGRIALITGANSGIGYETARALAARGADVVLGCRSEVRAAEAKAAIEETGPRGSVSVLPMDLADLDSVARAATTFAEEHAHLDLLINNAGLMATPKGTTAQGYETQFGVNHLGHFALTGRLIDQLLAAPGSRVVNVSSLAHHSGRMDFDDLRAERSYSPWRAYGQSKLANLLFTRELQRRLAAANADTIAVAAHPGVSSTNLGKSGTSGVFGGVVNTFRPVVDAMIQSAAMGALPTLRAAVDPSAKGGYYYGPRIFEQRGHPTKARLSSRAKDDAVAGRLWDVSVEATGVDFAPLG